MAAKAAGGVSSRGDDYGNCDGSSENRRGEKRELRHHNFGLTTKTTNATAASHNATAAHVGCVFDCWTTCLPELRRHGPARSTGNARGGAAGPEHGPRSTRNLREAGAVAVGNRAGAAGDFGSCTLRASRRRAWCAVRVEARRRGRRVVSSSNRCERDRRCCSACKQNGCHCFLQCRVHANGLPPTPEA